MAKRVMLAVAGAGKTYRICNELDPRKKNLILAYTHANIDNIVRELVKKHGRIPFLTEVMTFHSFLYRCAILPFQPSILSHFPDRSIEPNGICLDDPPAPTVMINGNRLPNRRYRKKTAFEHYVNANGRYYCATLSELIMEIKQGRNQLSKRIAKTTNRFYDMVLIDEFQDFREYDYKFIMALSKGLDDVLLVGDYYQHSVSGTNNSGCPFSIRKKAVSYEEFTSALEHSGFTVDSTTLRRSRRCSPDICELISEKLGIAIESEGVSHGVVKWVSSDTLRTVLKDDTIVKLVQQEARRYSFNACNWSYSKGNTYPKACVILTDAQKNFHQPDYQPDPTKPRAINRLYVALSRSSGDLLLVRSTDFMQVKSEYYK